LHNQMLNIIRLRGLNIKTRQRLILPAIGRPEGLAACGDRSWSCGAAPT
jgi:hypothetical protein